MVESSNLPFPQSPPSMAWATPRWEGVGSGFRRGFLISLLILDIESMGLAHLAPRHLHRSPDLCQYRKLSLT